MATIIYGLIGWIIGCVILLSIYVLIWLIRQKVYEIKIMAMKQDNVKE